jgi:glyoxylase-like metal-dependent hydrolase (beta-lactamase superfamily II)
MEPIFQGILLLRDGRDLCSNAYVVRARDGSEKILLVDSGDGKLEGVAGLEPELVLLTHGHFDHTGGVKKRWRALLHEGDFLGDRFIRAPAHAEKYPLEMRVRWRDWNFEIIHTPGHTPGSVSIFERKSGVLFSGDTLFSEGILGRTDLGFGSQEQIEQSRDDLLALDYSVLCPGHDGIERRR